MDLNQDTARFKAIRYEYIRAFFEFSDRVGEKKSNSKGLNQVDCCDGHTVLPIQQSNS